MSKCGKVGLMSKIKVKRRNKFQRTDSSNLQQLHNDQIAIVAKMVGYKEKVCHCGEESEHLSNLSHGKPEVAPSSSAPSFPDGQSPVPIPIPPPTTGVPAAELSLPSSETSDSDNTGDKPPLIDQVHVEYIVVPCPVYLHFPRQEQVKFF